MTLEVGKLLPSFGVGYRWRPTDFITRATRNRNMDKSKYMVDINFFYDFLNLELIYAPNKEFIPDDYADVDTILENDDFWLARLSLSLSYTELSLLYFHGNGDSIGINASSQVGDEFIPYCEVVLSNENRIKRMVKDESNIYSFEKWDDPFLMSLVGFCLSPTEIDFSIYFEFLYNGAGYSVDEWFQYNEYIREINELPPVMTAEKMGYLGLANMNFSLTNMSHLYLFLNVQTNDYLGGIFSIANTIIMTYPTGFLNNLDLSFKFLDNIYFDITFLSLLYATDQSEYSYFPNDMKIDLNLYYKVNF
jgi:hypothetical protein